ncbi:MAG: ribonuclease H family protein [Bacteroidota bacterium]
MSKKKSKYYVVWQGIVPGIYSSWDECQKQIQGYVGALYKSFESLPEAERALKESHKKHIGKTAKKELPIGATPIIPSICVDAACAGVPGPMEYRGVITHSKKEIFKMGPYPDGTNNIGEFLAIVHGLAFLKKNNSNVAIYTDSVTAMAWVRHKKCKTKHAESLQNKKLFDFIRHADLWLENNTFSNPILKWPTEIWGEIPADFGRK